MQQQTSLVPAFGLPTDWKQTLDWLPNVGMVDMGEWAYAEGQTILSTMGAAPCLNVVVHNGLPGKERGCVTHISHYTLNQRNLYDTACTTILILIQKCRTTPNDPLTIFFGSGYAFHPGSIFASQNPVAQDFLSYLSEFLHGHGIDMQKIALIADYLIKVSEVLAKASAFDPGNIIYQPHSHKVIILSVEDVVFLTQMHKGMQSPAADLHKVDEIK